MKQSSGTKLDQLLVTVNITLTLRCLESMLGSLQNTLDGPTKNSLLLNPDYAVHSSNVLFEEIESVHKSTSAGVGVET